jgi:hypothetical protein
VFTASKASLNCLCGRPGEDLRQVCHFRRAQGSLIQKYRADRAGEPGILQLRHRGVRGQIGKLIYLIQSIQDRIQNKTTKPDLISILSANKDLLSKQIKERFKKLIETIKNEEKKAVQKL